MTTQTISYSSNTTITMDLSALASSATWVAGVESNEIDNTSNKYIDAIVQGAFIVGTTPTINTLLNVYVWGSDISLATRAIGALDGTGSAETITTTVAAVSLALAASSAILVNTSDTTYITKPFSVVQLFGGIMPKFWGLFVAHNMTAALKTDAGNTDSFRYNGIKFDFA